MTFPLLACADNKNLELAKLLLDYHADVNQSDCLGFTALHLAVMQRDILMLTMLLSHIDIDTTLLNDDEMAEDLIYTEYENEEEEVDTIQNKQAHMKNLFHRHETK